MITLIQAQKIRILELDSDVFRYQCELQIPGESVRRRFETRREALMWGIAFRFVRVSRDDVTSRGRFTCN